MIILFPPTLINLEIILGTKVPFQLQLNRAETALKGPTILTHTWKNLQCIDCNHQGNEKEPVKGPKNLFTIAGKIPLLLNPFSGDCVAVAPRCNRPARNRIPPIKETQIPCLFHLLAITAVHQKQVKVVGSLRSVTVGFDCMPPSRTPFVAGKPNSQP